MIGKSQWRSIRIPLRTVEGTYGSDNCDNAGDDIVYALQKVSDYADQFNYRFDFDRSHPNPWYHVMVFEIDGISDSMYARFVESLAGIGLLTHEV
jgi:hypothetical protein